MIELLKENYEWLFGGIGVATLFFILDKLVFKSKTEKGDKNNNKTNNSITINNNINSSGTQKEQKETSKEKENRIKEKTKILFIDDNHTDFKIVSILKKNGWINTKSIKDVINLDDPKVKDADVIFVDINGVGTNLFNDEGLGLASALKKKYKNKKIIIYSADTKGDRFHKALREVDGCLSKDAEPFQFSSLIESLVNDLKI